MPSVKGLSKGLLWLLAAFAIALGCKSSSESALPQSTVSSNSVGFSVPIPDDVAKQIHDRVEVKLTMWATSDGVKPTDSKAEKVAGGYQCSKVVSETQGNVQKAAGGGDANVGVEFESFRCGSSEGQAGADASTLGRTLNAKVKYSGFELIIYAVHNGKRLELYRGEKVAQDLKGKSDWFEIKEGAVTSLEISVTCTDEAQAAGLCSTSGKSLKAVGFAGEQTEVANKIRVQVTIEETPQAAVDKKGLARECLNNINNSKSAARKHCEEHISKSKGSTAFCDDLIAKAGLSSNLQKIDSDAAFAEQTFNECQQAGFFEEVTK